MKYTQCNMAFIRYWTHWIDIYICKHIPRLLITEWCLLSVDTETNEVGNVYFIYAQWSWNLVNTGVSGVSGSQLSVCKTSFISPIFNDKLYSWKKPSSPWSLVSINDLQQNLYVMPISTGSSFTSGPFKHQ